MLLRGRCLGEMLTICLRLFAGNRPSPLRALPPSPRPLLRGSDDEYLKDVWKIGSRGACWLPQEVFTRHGVDLAEVVEPTL